MPKTILLVDDEPSILKVVSFRLKKEGYNVMTASDGQAAIDWARELKPDLVLLDVALPLVDGYGVCKEIKSNKETMNIPVIFFTASSTGLNMEEKVKEYKADGYVMKPFEPDVLLATIKKLIG